MCPEIKVSKGAKIRKRYNQVLELLLLAAIMQIYWIRAQKSLPTVSIRFLNQVSDGSSLYGIPSNIQSQILPTSAAIPCYWHFVFISKGHAVNTLATRIGIFPASIANFFKQNDSFCCCWFCCFTSQVNSYGHCGTVSLPNHTFSWAGLNKRITSNSCTYFRL